MANDWKPRPGSQAELFLRLAAPDSNGYSRAVWVIEFVGEFASLKLGNGGSWCRESSSLGKHYNIERRKDGQRIVCVQLHGFKEQGQVRQIPVSVRRAISGQPCVVLATGQVEVDHRAGRGKALRTDSAELTEDDFQPMSKAANNAKRQHCKTCRDTDTRFDAKRLGFPVIQIYGKSDWQGSCLGCHWYDPIKFVQETTKHYQSRLLQTTRHPS